MVYINNSPFNLTAIVSENDNTASMMSSGMDPRMISYSEWLRLYGEAVAEAGKNPKSIILPAAKTIPGISH